MSERPILMTAESVRAILAGHKTETRRVIRFRVPGEVTDMPKHDRPFANSPPDEVFWSANHRQPKARRDVVEQHVRCPYGVPGDRLYVKEGLRKINLAGMEAFWAFYDASLTEASGRVPLSGQASDGCGAAVEWKWKKDFLAARFMPKWVARLWLEVVEVRVERVQNITPQAAKREGVDPYIVYPYGANRIGYEQAFVNLWDRLNAKRKMLFQWTDDETGEVHSEWVSANYGWDEDPWVWVIRFKRSVKP